MARYNRNPRSLPEIASDPSTPHVVLMQILQRGEELSNKIVGFDMEDLNLSYRLVEICLSNPSLNVVEFFNSKYSLLATVSGNTRYVLDNFAVDLAMMDGSIAEVSDLICHSCARSIGLGEEIYRYSDVPRFKIRRDDAGLGTMEEVFFLEECHAISYMERHGKRIPDLVPASQYRKLAQIASMFLPRAVAYGKQHDLFPSVMIEYMPNRGRGGRRGSRRLPGQDEFLLFWMVSHGQADQETIRIHDGHRH